MFFHVYKSGAQFRWRLRAGNGEIIADSAESYWNKADCYHAINLVKGTTAWTPIHETP